MSYPRDSRLRQIWVVPYPCDWMLRDIWHMGLFLSTGSYLIVAQQQTLSRTRTYSETFILYNAMQDEWSWLNRDTSVMTHIQFGIIQKALPPFSLWTTFPIIVAWQWTLIITRQWLWMSGCNPASSLCQQPMDCGYTGSTTNNQSTNMWTMILTVAKQASWYSKQAYRQASMARKLQNIIMRPAKRKCYEVDIDYLADCPIIKADFIAAEKIFGPTWGHWRARPCGERMNMLESGLKLSILRYCRSIVR
jgi:hypothetical protein